MLTVKHKVNEILAKHTGKSLKKVEQDTDRDNFLNAKEAVSYGIIDEILEKRPVTNGK
jgi:ATP-dependent Clp protease protease subunit